MFVEGVRDVEVMECRSWIKITTNINVANSLVGCEFGKFNHIHSLNSVIRCNDNYYVPKEFDELIEFIAPIHGFPLVPKPKILRSEMMKGIGIKLYNFSTSSNINV